MGKLFKIALGLIIIGFGLFAIFSLLSDEPIWGSVNEEDYTFNEVVYDVDDFSGIDFDFENRDYIIRNTDEDNIKVTYYSSDEDRVEVIDTGEELILNNEIDLVLRWFSGLIYVTNPELFDVYVYLPSDANYDLTLDTSNGKLEILNYSNLGDIDFDTSNGTISLENVNFASLDAETSNGAISLDNVVSAGTVDLYTSNGSITLTNVLASAKIYFKTSNGNLYLTDLTAPMIEGKTSNNGIEANNLVTDNLNLDTSNGTIDVTIVDDKANYSVDMSTSNGSLYYDGLKVDQNTFNTSAAKIIYLHSSNGSVTLDFDD